MAANVKLIFVLFFYFFCQNGKTQDEGRFLHVGFNLETYAGNKLVVAPGFSIGYQLNFANEISFVRLGSAFAFGYAEQGSFNLFDPNAGLVGGYSAVTSDYRFLKVGGNLTYNHFIKGDIFDGGFFITGGIGFLMFDLDFYNTRLKSNGALIQTPQSETFLMMNGLIGGGYIKTFDGFALFADGSINFPFGAQKSYFKDNQVIGRPFVGLQVGLIFPIPNLFNYWW